MVAIDCQPYSIVEDFGFSRLVLTLEPQYPLPSRKFLTESIIPRVKSEVSNRLEGGYILVSLQMPGQLIILMEAS